MRRRDFLATGAAAAASLALPGPRALTPPARRTTTASWPCARWTRPAGRGRLVRGRARVAQPQPGARHPRAADHRLRGLRDLRVRGAGAGGRRLGLRRQPRDHAGRGGAGGAAGGGAGARQRGGAARPVELAPVEAVPDGRWRSPIEIDPFDVPIEEKVDLLCRANAAALGVAGRASSTRPCSSCGRRRPSPPPRGRTPPDHLPLLPADDGDGGGGTADFQTRQSTDVQPMGLGYEHVRDATWWERAALGGGRGGQALGAAGGAGRYDLVLMPSHLWLTIHESIAHPTELDRIMGFEANYAGTSFIYPIEDYLGKLPLRPGAHERAGERSAPGSRHRGLGRRGGAPGRVPDREGRHAERPADHPRAGAPGWPTGTAAAAARCARTATATRRAGRTCSSSGCPT
jgi:hypothetical protein